MNKIKSIFVIKGTKYVGMDAFSTMMRSTTIEEMKSDYYILFVKADVEDFEFECFNSDEADRIKFEQLQSKLLELANYENTKIR